MVLRLDLLIMRVTVGRRHAWPPNSGGFSVLSSCSTSLLLDNETAASFSTIGSDTLRPLVLQDYDLR